MPPSQWWDATAERAQDAVTRIRQETGNNSVDFLLADLSSQEQVRQLASDFTERYPNLHLLINDAGAIFWSRQETVDGLEMTLALNHLAPFLLTNLLLPTLQASAPARIITVASDAHQRTTIPFDDLQQQNNTLPGIPRPTGSRSWPTSSLPMSWHAGWRTIRQ